MHHYLKQMLKKRIRPTKQIIQRAQHARGTMHKY